MSRTRCAYGPLIAGIVSVALLRVGTVVRTQDRTPQSIVDGVVNAVCQKQIVLLGELPTHGEAHTFDAKSKIADRLMTQCGFTAILFEAPIYDFIGLERAAAARTAAPEQLDNAIGRFWWTRELTSWRRALFEAATSQRVVAGGTRRSKVSITSHYARAALPRLIAAASSGSAATECRQTVSRHVGWTYDAKDPFDEREQLRLQQCARNAAAAAGANRSFDAADRVMVESFARYADRQRQGVTSDRDESMYQNLVWYLERLPANSRVVIWTATVHAARQRGSLYKCRWVRGSSGDGAIESALSDLRLMQATPQWPGGLRAQSLMRRRNRWKPRRRAHQPGRCLIPKGCEQSAGSRHGCWASSFPKPGRTILTSSS